MNCVHRFFFAAIIVLIQGFSNTAYANGFYISNAGNDNATGQSAGEAWQSLDMLNANFYRVKPGDTVFFKRGAIFYGNIRITQSGIPGKPIVFTAYGSGSDPVITGFTVLKGWKQKSGKIFEADAPGVHPGINMITMDGIPQRIGRYPNASAADGGYLRYEDFDGNNSITDNELTGTVNWTGAEVVIRKNHWTAERCRVTAHSGKEIKFTYANSGINPLKEPVLYKGAKGFGYFFQNDIRTLDENGEWFFDSSNGKLLMVMDNASHVIQASTIDTLVDTDNKSYLYFSNLVFEGANRSALYNKEGGHIFIVDCSFNNIGAKAIHFWNTGDVWIDGVQTNYVLSNAIQLRTTKKDNAVVKNCVIRNTGTFIGMGSFFDDRDYKAVHVMMHNNVTIEHNTIDSVGLSGIQFQGNNVLVQQNTINHYCMVLDDGAGIYTFVEVGKESAGENYTNRVIQQNLVLNGIGAPAGSYPVYKAEGIYMDGRTMNVDIHDNVIAYTGNKALALNNPVNIRFRNNTCFDNGGGWGVNRGINWLSLQQLSITNNIFFPLDASKPLANFNHSGLDVPAPVNIWQAIKNAGDIDSNYYHLINPVAFVYAYAPVAGKPAVSPSPLTFTHWQEYTGQDLHSAAPVKKIPSFLFRGKKGNNLISNGTFDKDVNGFTLFGNGVKMEWEGSGKLTGKGALKVVCSDPQPNRFSLIHSAVGTVQAGKKYLLRFKTSGNSDCGILKVYLRKTEKPYTAISAAPVQPFTMEIQQHEFVLAPSATVPASIVIELEKNACVAYLDDIELYEANAELVNLKDHVRFEYNAQDTPVTIPLQKKYVGVDGKAFGNSITLPPFSAKILIEDLTW